MLIKNVQIVNEGVIKQTDVLIKNGRIDTIAPDITPKQKLTVFDGKGQFLLPGLIDDQVHFREPGLTHKATIETESKAALAGGITSFIEMPNTVPQATTNALLNEKFERASATAWVNYSFMFGGTNTNLEEILRADKHQVAALKLFLGSSTGDMLVDDPHTLEAIFKNTDFVIATHCEDEATIQNNLAAYKARYGEAIPMACHPKIRSEEACYLSSSMAINLAKQTGARLHVFHLSTAKETALFENTLPLHKKQITAEVCAHHLWFTEADYPHKGSLIKWNPAVKTAEDKEALWKALLDDRIDVLATDHAPHTLAEKQQPYTQAPSGGPLVQHALLSFLEAYKDKRISLPKLVEKACHNPAILFNIAERGFIREGYWADLVLVNTEKPHTVTKENLLYKCGWSPFEGTTFSSSIEATWINGELGYHNGLFTARTRGKQLTFTR